MPKTIITKKQAKLILGIMDTCKYDQYYQLWEFVEDKEIERLEKKLEKLID